jgi:predicted PurR-regulated permease PerM
MSESYLPPSGGEGTCSGVAIQVAFFLLALALFVINTSAGLFFAVVLTYIFHRTICESLRLGWRNVVIKLFIFIIALSILIVVAWFLAGPYMVAIINIINYIINNVRQIIYPGNVAALSGRWPYILLISLMLFYTPIVHQDRRCLAP